MDREEKVRVRVTPVNSKYIATRITQHHPGGGISFTLILTQEGRSMSNLYKKR